MKWYLDFGHGGKDPGAIDPTNLKESNVALKIGMIIKTPIRIILGAIQMYGSTFRNFFLFIVIPSNFF